MPTSPARRALNRLPLHPLFFAAFPVLYAYAESRREVDLPDILAPLGLVLGGAALLLLLGTLAYRSASRAALAVSMLVILFFSYGYVVSALRHWRIGDFVVGAHRVWLPIWILAAVAGAVVAARAGGWLPTATRALNVSAIALVAINLATVAGFQLGPGVGSEPALAGPPPVEGASPEAGRPIDKRDVYYIVLDRYARSDVLHDLVGYDNTPFEGFLRGRGFHVAAHARANYPRTLLSLTSTLNMSYLDDIAGGAGPGSSDERPLRQALKRHAVGRIFQEEGYRYVHLGSWYGPTAKSPIADTVLSLGGFSEFSTAIFERTAAAPFGSAVSEKLNFRKREYLRVKFQLEQLGKVGSRPGPLFVFAHILATHGPYLFDRNGRYVSAEVQQSHPFEENYRDQVIWLNGEIERLVDELLAGPDEEDPIIILQSDEGPRSYPPELSDVAPEALRQKFAIFSAIYLPGLDRSPLGDAPTPVNTFRAVFNRYLGFDLAMLPDRTFIYRDLDHLYEFEDVTALVSGA